MLSISKKYDFSSSPGHFDPVVTIQRLGHLAGKGREGEERKGI